MKRVMAGSVTVSGLPCLDLLDEQRNDRTARRHHVAVAGDADDGRAVVAACRDLATTSFSIIALEMPMALIG